jgi:hypothetical protein
MSNTSLGKLSTRSVWSTTEGLLVHLVFNVLLVLQRVQLEHRLTGFIVCACLQGGIPLPQPLLLHRFSAYGAHDAEILAEQKSLMYTGYPSNVERNGRSEMDNC